MLQDINMTPKELKTERNCSHRQLFRPIGARQNGATTEKTDEKYPRTLILSPDPELSHAWIFFIRAFSVVAPCWRAPKRAKQLSMATIPFCFKFFGCHVDVLQSYFSRSTISIAVFRLQNLICLRYYFAGQVFIDPTFFGIFACSPLQSFVVNVCTYKTKLSLV